MALQDITKSIISCECGYRKDADTIWDYVFTKYGKDSFVHVGDRSEIRLADFD